MTTLNNPKTITIRGRLSFPRFSHKEAVAGALRSKIAQVQKTAQTEPNEIAPEFNLLLEPDQLDKLVQHVRTEFLPFALDRSKKGEKTDALDAKQVARIESLLDADDWADQPPYLMIKDLSPQNKEVAPETVASLKVVGSKGRDIKVEATVFSEDQLLVPDANILTFPVRKPIGETVFQPYAGAYFIATLNLYAYAPNPGLFGISASASTAFYMGNLEGEAFGAGNTVDEDSIFMD